jgi:hypothetical protein
MKGQHILYERAIWSRIIKLEAGQTKRGCAFGVELECDNLYNARIAFTNYGIPYSEIIGG